MLLNFVFEIIGLFFMFEKGNVLYKILVFKFR